ncbi:hypothetical protein K1719_013457 [Acacia pycnantha]|nr:hypothetical protein K1719_013457 [Acacia pycnantha]
MRKDLFDRRDLRQSGGLPTTKSNESYDLEEFAMPLHEFINYPVAEDIVHNGATFQVAASFIDLGLERFGGRKCLYNSIIMLSTRWQSSSDPLEKLEKLMHEAGSNYCAQLLC